MTTPHVDSQYHPNVSDGPETNLDTGAEQASRFLSTLFRPDDHLQGSIGVWRKSTRVASWFRATAEGVAKAAQHALAQPIDVYVHCTTHDTSKVGGRGNNDSAVELVALWADIDLAESGKDTEKRYPPLELVNRVLDSFPFRPSIKIDSGHGLHVYWLLERAVKAADYSHLVKRLQTLLKQHLVDTDTGEAFDMDATFDPARVFRVPGTTNSKGGAPVRILSLNPEIRYAAEQLDAELPQIEAKAAGTMADIDIGPLMLGEERKAPSAKLAELRKDRRFEQTWNYNRKDLADQSPSTYDMALANAAAMASWSPQEIADLITEFRVRHGNDEKIHREDYYQRTIKKALAAVAEERDGLTAEDELERQIDELNRLHAVVPMQGKTYVMTEHVDAAGQVEAVFGGEADLRALYRNRKVTVFGKSGRPRESTIAELWLEHPRRRQYQGICFNPRGTPEGFYNLFRGFPVRACEGNCALFLRLLREGICAGNGELYKYLVRWLAHLIQKPWELPGVALILRGSQGTGKGTTADVVGRLLGPYYKEVSNMKHVTGAFNAHLENALLVQAAEAVWGGNRSEAGPLKALITDPNLLIERKGVDAYKATNHIRMILTTNEQWAAHLDPDDRRFVVLDVADTFKENHEFFRALHEQLDSGGYEGLMHHLSTMDIKTFNPRVRPQCNNAFDMKLRSAGSLERWWYSVLNGGGARLYLLLIDYGLMRADNVWGGPLPKEILITDYRRFCTDNRELHVASESDFYAGFLRLTGAKRTRPNLGGGRRYCYTLPSLEVSRQGFEDRFKVSGLDWGEEEDDQGLDRGSIPDQSLPCPGFFPTLQ